MWAVTRLDLRSLPGHDAIEDPEVANHACDGPRVHQVGADPQLAGLEVKNLTAAWVAGGVQLAIHPNLHLAIEIDVHHDAMELAVGDRARLGYDARFGTGGSPELPHDAPVGVTVIAFQHGHDVWVGVCSEVEDSVLVDEGVHTHGEGDSHCSAPCCGAIICVLNFNALASGTKELLSAKGADRSETEVVGNLCR